MEAMTNKPTDAPTSTLPPHLLPPNATKLERAVIMAVLKQYAKHLPKLMKRKLWNAATCPVDLLPWLAWTFGLEVWDNGWPENIKRAQVRDAIAVARKRGTLASIHKVLSNYGGSFAVREWWELEPKGIPHTFELTLIINSAGGGGEASSSFIEAVMADIDRTKPVRSHYTTVQGLQGRSSLGIAGLARPIINAVLKMETDLRGLDFRATLGLATAGRAIVEARLKMDMD